MDEIKIQEIDPAIIYFTKPSLTKQAGKNEADINKIMAKYKKYGTLPTMIQKNPLYGDFSDVPTYQDSVHIVMHAQEQFNALPSNVRKQFNHDPVEMLAFIADPNNQEKAYELGLAVKPEQEVKGPEVTE